MFPSSVNRREQKVRIADPFRLAWNRLWYGNQRKLSRSRFHTKKGDFTLRQLSDFADCGYAFATGAIRLVFGWGPAIPWITLPAFRFIRSRVGPSTRFFEWGSGRSTVWFSRHCGEVHSVEDDPSWCTFVRKKVRNASVYLLHGPAYVEKVTDFPQEYFDIILIDGSQRLACYTVAKYYLRPGGILVIDNTDNCTTDGDLLEIDNFLGSCNDREIQRFPGWSHGNFFAAETTIYTKS